MVYRPITSAYSRTLYPKITPYRTDRLKVSDRHELYFEESGNAGGKPVVHLHGGPGVGCQPVHRQNFDPAAYRIVTFDQRGAGRSTPHADLTDNTTWHLVEDLEALRQHLGIERWQIFGGSWGSTLALAYAETHPERVSELILRGIFMTRQSEIAWLYQRGADAIFPDDFEDYVAPIPVDERGDLVAAFYRRLTSDDPAIQSAAALAWSKWEANTTSLYRSAEQVSQLDNIDLARAIARIECHYFVNGGFFENDTWLLDKIDAIRKIPGVIVQGRYDMVTPMTSAWDLHKAWPEAEFHIIPDAGHSAMEPGIVDALITATDKFRE